MSKWRDITANAYKIQDPRLPQLTKTAGGEFRAGDYVRQLGAIAGNTIAKIAATNAQNESRGKSNDQDLLAKYSGAGGGIPAKAYNDFVMAQIDGLKEADTLVNDNKRGTKEYEKGLALQAQLHQSLATVLTEKEQFGKWTEANKHINLNNMDNTVSPQGIKNQLDLNNGNLLTNNAFYISTEPGSMGKFMVKTIQSDRIMVGGTKSENERIQAEMVGQGIDPAYSNFLFMEGTQGDEGFAGYSDLQLQDKNAANPGSVFTQINVEGDRTNSDWKSNKRLVETKSMSVFDLNIGKADVQLQAGSLQDELFGKEGFMQQVARSGYDYKTKGFTAHNPDDEAANERVILNLGQKIDDKFRGRKPDEIASWMHNASIPVNVAGIPAITDDKGGVTTQGTSDGVVMEHPAAILLWQLGKSDYDLNNPRQLGKDMAWAMKTWETGPVTIKLGESSATTKDDKTVKWDTPEDYKAFRKNYSLHQMAIAQQPLTEENEQTLKTVLLDHALHQNKVAYEKKVEEDRVAGQWNPTASQQNKMNWVATKDRSFNNIKGKVDKTTEIHAPKTAE